MDLDSKKQKRKENKKRKMAAFLAVAELNDVEKKPTKKQKTSDVAEEEREDENDNPVADTAEPRELVTKYRLTDKPQLSGEEYSDLRRRLREKSGEV